jgi:hypothetical protein
MKRAIVVTMMVGALVMGLGGVVAAAPIQFTLQSYNVSLNESDPGLKLYWDPILTQPKTWNLDVGQSVTFNLFRIGTTEVAVNGDDEAKKPIVVNFAWAAPPSVIPDNVNGETSGWSWWFIDGGVVDWSDSPAVFNFGNGGQFRLSLYDANFGVPGYATIEAKLKYVSASVPEPMSFLLLGLGLLGIGAVRRKK